MSNTKNNLAPTQGGGGVPPRFVPQALVDSHAHLDFYDDPTEILANARAAGLSAILAIGIGQGPDTMHRALEIAQQHSTPELALYASAGIHPQEAHQATEAALEKLAKLAANPQILAIGEIGLDYYHLENPDIDVQQSAFIAQMCIARDARKPILIHCRTSELATPAAKARFGSADAVADLIHLIHERWTPSGLPGVMHCFSGSSEEAQQALAAGFYLSFAGNLTYPKALGIQQAAREAPTDRILVETDCPFLSPIPLRGQQNQPAHVTHTASFLAQLRNVSPEEIAQQTTRNFQTLFGLTTNN
jgi:TatD DNase family protein